jgi:NAD(P)-dependent dehydrogenase (short-subunit alcohol dehydrogenase family)
MLINDYFPKNLMQGKVVFVTGGGSGINLGIARNFAALGARIGMCGRSAERLEQAARELQSAGAAVFTRTADVRDAVALQGALDTCRDELGPIDVLVCGAAGNFLVPAEQLSPNGFRTVVDIDLMGSFNAVHAGFEQLRSTRGSIIFISAAMAHVPHAYQLHVGAAKAGIDNMMKNLALEWGRYGIRCNSIMPGPVRDTEGMRRLSTPELEAELIKTIPMGRMGLVDDIGQAAVFLASPLASHITGTLLAVDGGQHLAGSAGFNKGAELILAGKHE